MFSFGWQEAFICSLLITPLAGFFAAIIMWIGASAKNIRQAQTNTTIMLLIVAFLPMFSQIRSSEIVSTHFWLPVASQHYLIMSIFKGNTFQLRSVLLPLFVSLSVTFFCLYCASVAFRRART
jgi:hypothetical protein